MKTSAYFSSATTRRAISPHLWVTPQPSRNATKKLNLACADLIADYDEAAQTAFIEMCQIDGYAPNKQTMSFIQTQCPPPAADQQAVYAAWREARAKAAQRAAAPPKKLSFDRKRFAPYLSKFKSDKEIEELFILFLKQHTGLP